MLSKLIEKEGLAAVSTGGTLLVSGNSDRAVKLRDAETGEVKRAVPGNTPYDTSVAFGPSGSAIASGSRCGEIRLWDAVTGVFKNTLQGRTGSAVGVVFGPCDFAIA